MKSLPADAGGTGSIPNPGRSHVHQRGKAHELQLLSLSSRVWEPQLLSPRATTRETAAMRSLGPTTAEQRLLSAMRKRPVQQQRSSTAKD